jgi:hypothetical protein
MTTSNTTSKTERPSAAVPTEPADGDKKPRDNAPNSGPKPGGPKQTVEEIGGRDGPDPTRYGDYEKDGRCVDF